MMKIIFYIKALFAIILLHSTLIANAQTIKVEHKETKQHSGGTHEARIDFISRFPDLIFEEGNGETIQAPKKIEGGLYLYTCICDARDTNNFGFEIEQQGREGKETHNVNIKAGELKSFTVDIKDESIRISEVKVENDKVVVREEYRARVTVSCKQSILVVKSMTGEKVEGPTKKENGYDYVINYDLSSKAAREQKRVLSLSVDNENFEEHELGILSPKQGVEISVILISVAQYFSHKSSAEKFYANGQYGEATEAYMKAQNSPDKPKEMDFSDQISKTNSILIALNKANSLFISEKWSEAKQTYTELLALNPNDNYVAQKIKDCDIKLEPPKAFPPTVSTGGATDIKTNSFAGSGNVDNTGGLPVSSRGICWSMKNQEPTIDDNKTVVEGELGDFKAGAADLYPNRTYYVRAFAQNSAGVAYGNVTKVVTAVGEPWTKLPTGFSESLGKTGPLFYFSNGKNIYVVLSTVGGGAPLVKYNIATKKWHNIGDIGSWHNTTRVNESVMVVDNIAYMPVAANTNSGVFLGLARFDMEEEGVLPVIMSNMKTWTSGSPTVMHTFAIDKICYFILSNRTMITYDINTGQFKQKKPFDKELIFRDKSTVFTIKEKAYLIVTYGKVFEYNPQTDAWAERPNHPAKFHDNLLSFSLNGKGYIWSVGNSDKMLYEFNPDNNIWKKRSDVSQMVPGRFRMAFQAGEEKAVIATGSSIMDCYLYDPLQENF